MSTALTLRPVRKLAMVLAVAGVTGLGAVAAAPAALAADDGVVEQDGGAYVIEGNGNGGPDYFIVLEDGGRIPVFFCDPEKPHQHHNKCLVVGGPRF